MFSSKGGVTFATFPIFLTICVRGVVHEYSLPDMQIKKEMVLIEKVENETVFFSLVRHLRSHGYPDTCCQPYVYSVVSDDLRSNNCIHLVFDDLDLPLNASLTVLEVVENVSSVIFQYTSGTQDNVFLCDSLKACRQNSSLLIILSHKGKDTLPFVGFSARLWASSVGSSYSAAGISSTYSVLPKVPCQILSTIVPGQQFHEKIISSNEVLDYVWIIKSQSAESYVGDFVVSVQMTIPEVEGDLEVRRGVYSGATVILQKSLTSLIEPFVNLTFESDVGLHVRLRIKPNVTSSYVVFVTRLQKSLVSSAKPVDSSSISFLKWLLPLVGGFVLVGICFFIIKIYMKNKYHHHEQCNDAEAVHPIRLPLLHLPNQTPSGRQPERSSVIFIPSGPHRQISFGESPPQSGSHRSSFPRTAPVPIPMTRSAPIAIPIVVRPQVHHDGRAFPPSYEEVTADHSCGNSSDSLDELEQLPEYHPPSYEDASQGEAGVVSSWLSSAEKSISE